jgi:saccharopine dehydrogenase-like NADP-dependent oxidoreductase
MKYLVYGAGKVGLAVVYDLLQHCNATLVTVVEPSQEVGVRADSRLYELLGTNIEGRCAFVYAAPEKYLNTYDVVISCAPYAANEEITRTALYNNVPMVDLGGNPEMVAKQENLAKDSKTLIVPECGISPGISNQLATQLAQEGMTNIQVRCGGIIDSLGHMPLSGFAHKMLFSVDGLLSEYYGRAPVIRRGCFEFVDARKEYEFFYKDGLRLLGSITTNNSVQAVQSLYECGVKNYDYMTLRYQDHWSAFGVLEKKCGGDREELRRLLMDTEYVYSRDTDRDRLILRVTGSNGKSLLRRQEIELDIKADPHTKFSAMEMTTAWGATIVANHIALCRRDGPSSALPSGFNTPEKVVKFDSLWMGLRRRIDRLEAGSY